MGEVYKAYANIACENFRSRVEGAGVDILSFL